MEVFILPEHTNSKLETCYNDKIADHNKSCWRHHEWDDYGDSGFDLFVPPKSKDDGKWIIAGKSTVKIPLGIKLVRTDRKYYMPIGQRNPERLPDGRTLPYYVYPRSSISKTPLRLANSVGIIDAGYRGELIAVFDNTSNKVFELEPYTRLVQACCPNLEPFGVKMVVNDFENTKRGEGGFGSTGR